MAWARTAPVLLALALAVVPACGGSADGRAAGGADRAVPPPLTPTATAKPADAAAVDTTRLPKRFTEQSLRWSRCGAPDPEQGDHDASPPPLPGDDGRATVWECARITAPLDYAEPDGATIELALIRARSQARGERRIGSLLFNFGGPGGSGVATLPAFARDYADLRTRYDLVSFDPRGVGGSRGLVCLDDRELDAYLAADAVPDDAAERADLAERLAHFADACADRAGRLLPHLTTTNTARDLDLMRQVLGDDTLHYVGVSYGTRLGGVYAHLFPERVGRMVFDAVVDPTLTPEASARSQAAGFQRALGNYVRACADGTAGDGGDDVCPLGDTEAAATDRLAELFDRLDQRPMPTRDPDGRRLTQSLAVNGVAQALYSRDFWPYLTQGLADALAEEDPDGTVLLALGDALNGRSPDGRYTTLQTSLAAITCADTRQRHDADDVRAALASFRDASPVFGESLAWGLLGCAYWPVAGAEARPQVAAPGAPPILLVGTTGDPATPYEGTRRMKRALGEGVGVVVTYDGEGHGAYTAGSDCVRAAVDGYLLAGRVPKDGTVCGG